MQNKRLCGLYHTATRNVCDIWGVEQGEGLARRLITTARQYVVGMKTTSPSDNLAQLKPTRITADPQSFQSMAVCVNVDMNHEREAAEESVLL